MASIRGRLPGSSVIGQVFRRGAGTPRDFPRYTGFIAKALDIKLFRNAELLRGEQTGVTLSFSGTTYTAPLTHTAVPDKSRSRLYTTDGRTVPATRWDFQESVEDSGDFDEVVIDPAQFSVGATYLLDYVSDDPAVQDEIPVDDLREVLSVGDNASQVSYREGVDFEFPTSITGPESGDDNANATGSVLTAIDDDSNNTGTGVIAFSTGAAYTHNYNRTYVATVTAAAGVSPNRTATIRVEVYPTSSGTTATFGRTAAMANAVTILLNEATPSTLSDIAVEHGILLDFTFGATHFVVNDVYTWSGNGPAVLELSDALLGTNQFPTISAVVVGGGNSGDGAVEVNPQSAYSGAQNQSYELEVTAVTASPADATFRWRTNPSLKQLTGTLTATNGSASVTGVGTLFVSEVAVGDVLFIGSSGKPVTVLSIQSALQLTLSAAWDVSTETTKKALRVRQSTGTVTVAESDPNRVLINNGIRLDFDFGGGNFDVGDTFSFNASVKATPYNGKENRTYELDVTSTSVDHQTTMSFSGNTPTSGFGSHAFSEGNPLILPNNLVLHARNVSLDNRFSTASPDSFTVSVTFDGVIDWSLEQEKSETFTGTQILRDLTGSRTGVVGAYFILLKKVPTSIVFVRNSALENVAFNHVAESTIVYFTADPASTLTVAYRHAGNEPSAGSTYFMSGYIKRPDEDYDFPHLFFTRGEAADFLAPMTPANDAAIANEIAWDQDELALPGVAVFLVKDSDGDGIYTEADYVQAIRVSEGFEGIIDASVVNQFSARSDFRDSVVNMNDPVVFRQRIGYVGFPKDYPIGNEYQANSRVFVARREMQVHEDTPAKGTLVVVGNSWAKKTIRVDALGDGNLNTIPTQVTLDGSFLALALAARISSFSEPWETPFDLPVSGFDEVEPLTTQQMIQLNDAGIVVLRVEGSSAFYVGTHTTDETEPSTQQISGTVQRQYVLARLKNVTRTKVAGFVADTPEEMAQKIQVELIAELSQMVSEGKIAKYIDEATGIARPINQALDIEAFRDKRNPLRSYYRTHWYQKYANLYTDGLVAVDGPKP